MKTLSLLFNKLVSPIKNWVSKHYNKYLEATRQEVELLDKHNLQWNRFGDLEHRGPL